MKKKKRFYDNKNRNRKWTEPEVGRPIDFAEKYEESEGYSSGYDNQRAKKNNEKQRTLRQKKHLQRLGAVLLAAVLVCVGYIGMEVHILRHEEPLKRFEALQENGREHAAYSVSFAAQNAEGVNFDGGVMLTSLIGELKTAGFTGVGFEAKRQDGSLAYLSALSAVNSFDAVSSPASNLKASVNELRAEDITPVAVISCYRDNLVPALAPEMALMEDGRVYLDENGSTYLDPDSEAAYGYIRDIIGELSGMGINVFVLKDCTLPADIREGHHDGFDALAEKLSADLKYDIRLLEAAEVSLTGSDEAACRKEIKAFPQLKASQVYVITAGADTAVYREALQEAGIDSYLINH